MDILADVREDASLTEAQILAGNTKSGQSFHASDTKRDIFWSNVDSKYYRDDNAQWSGSAWVAVAPALYASLRLSSLAGTGERQATIQADGTIIEATVPLDLESKRTIKHGFVSPEDNMWTYTDGTRTIDCAHSSGTVEYWTYGVKYSYANGHASLSHQVPDLNQDSWGYFDNTGQLSSKPDLVWDDVKMSCLAPHVKYDPASAIFYFRIERNEDAEANHIENFASYKTKSLQEAEKALFDGAVGDTQTGHTSGEYFTSRDYQYFVPTKSATSIDWLNYYYDGIDDNSKDCIKLYLSPIPTGRPYILDSDIGLGIADNLVYNEFNIGNDEFDILVCPSNNYVIGFIATADGGEQKIVALAPQGKYSNLANAQAAIPDAKGALIGSNNIFKDVTVLSAYIMRGDQIGGFINVGTGSAFYNYEVSLGGGSAAVGSQDLQGVTDNGATTTNPIETGGYTNAVSTNNATEVLALGGTAFQTADSADTRNTIEQILTNGSDANSQQLVNLSRVTSVSTTAMSSFKGRVNSTINLFDISRSDGSQTAMFSYDGAGNIVITTLSSRSLKIVNGGIIADNEIVAGAYANDTTANRPATPVQGQPFIDTTLGIPIWYINSNWVDATGATV